MDPGFQFWQPGPYAWEIKSVSAGQNMSVKQDRISGGAWVKHEYLTDLANVKSWSAGMWKGSPTVSDGKEGKLQAVINYHVFLRPEGHA